MTSTSSAVNLTDDDAMAQRLRALLEKHAPDSLSVVAWSGAEERRWSIDADGRVSSGADALELRIPASCGAKLFTATTVVAACARHGIGMDEDLGELLGKQDAKRRRLFDGVTFKHLLMHAHGLDDVHPPRYPRFDDGRIDLDQLQDRLAPVPRLARPGSLFSSADLGPLLAAAAMEQLLGVGFERLLADTLRDCFDIEAMRSASSSLAWHDTPSFVCPSTGGALTLTARDLIQLAKYHSRPGAARVAGLSGDPALTQSSSIDFPAWTTMGQRACLGWHGFAGDWYGYNATTLSGASLLLRFHPQSSTAIAIVSKRIPVFTVYHALLGDRLPEFQQHRPPRLLSAAELRGLDIAALEGRYDSGPFSAIVRGGEQRRLEMIVCNRSSSSLLAEPIKMQLMLGVDSAFFAMPIHSMFFAYGAFLHHEASDARATHLWNGRTVWRRAA